ncbi:MAG: hypothetical protein XU12_C0034G0007 [Deltaproteobacteria bacterium CSP1-8]|jgi:hypothetical protein|nr:MAG: hypothetical protein XU12_C0034G0007 [Deltaproteobacteria bacterium CSP1-8]
MPKHLRREGIVTSKVLSEKGRTTARWPVCWG